MAYKIAYRPKARSDLREIYRWIANGADAQTAAGYVGRIQTACAKLTNFPNRDSPREDLEPGLRSVAFEGRATIYYRVETTRVRSFAFFGRARPGPGIQYLIRMGVPIRSGLTPPPSEEPR